MELVNWIYVDLNSYFASAEQQFRPELRGRPVGVVPMMAETTSCLAASVQAKKFGVKTGTRVSDARKMCPGIVFVEADHKRYVDLHERIIEVVESCLPVTKVCSIDEMACRLTGRDRNVSNAVALAQQIKQKIVGQVGECLTASVGVAPSRYLAKVASDMQKPDGLTVVLASELPQRLWPLKLRDLPGVGEKMEARLLAKGIRTMEQICKADVNTLRAVWGSVHGERVYHWLRGADVAFDFSDEPKSIGHSHVLPPQMRTDEGAYQILQKLLHKAAFRLRREGLLARLVYVGVRYMSGEKYSNVIRVSPCSDTHTLAEVARRIWSHRKKGQPLKVSITFSDFIPESQATLSFFHDEKRDRASRAMDTLNSKYGRHLLYLADMKGAEKSAPDRIAFANIPDFDLEGE